MTKRRGRPPALGERMVPICFHISAEQLMGIQGLAALTGVSQSEYLRRAVANVLETFGPSSPPADEVEP